MNEMTCREFDEIVHGYVRMELLDVHLREAALEHTAHCGLCAARMQEAMALADATEARARLVGDQQAPSRVEDALRTAFRARHRFVAWRRTFQWATMGAAAAVFLIFLWTLGVRSTGPSQPAQKNDRSSNSTAPLDARGSASVPEKYVPQQTDETALDRLADASANVASAGPTYVATDFVPVPFTGSIAPDDPGMVVRVQLTRASLAQLGYPVAVTADEDLISADVLVGEDGWPRGVKLVQ
jgi:hypothetical protein